MIKLIVYTELDGIPVIQSSGKAKSVKGIISLINSYNKLMELYAAHPNVACNVSLQIWVNGIDGYIPITIEQAENFLLKRCGIYPTSKFADSF